MRYENSLDLFGAGLVIVTYGDIKCDICKITYNSVSHTVFAGLTVCDCCFEKIENEILDRMPNILLWYRRILNSRKERVDYQSNILKTVEESHD